MAYPLGLTAKSLAGIAGAFSATTGGVLLFNIGGVNPLDPFDVKVEEVLKKLGTNRNWCRKEGSNRYICKNNSKDNLKKIHFKSKHAKNVKYEIKDDYPNVEIGIEGIKDDSIFPEGLKFVIGKSDKDYITIKKTEDAGKWPFDLKVVEGGIFKTQDNAMFWVWEEINDLVGRIGMKCIDTPGKTCTLQDNQKINVKDGKKITEDATIDKNKTLNFLREQKGFFQGYKFTPQDDIQLNSEGEIKEVTKLEKQKPYQILFDEKRNKWYLTKK